MERKFNVKKRNGEIIEVLETTERAESSYGIPVYVVDGDAYTLWELQFLIGIDRDSIC